MEINERLMTRNSYVTDPFLPTLEELFCMSPEICTEAMRFGAHFQVKQIHTLSVIILSISSLIHLLVTSTLYQL